MGLKKRLGIEANLRAEPTPGSYLASSTPYLRATRRGLGGSGSRRKGPLLQIGMGASQDQDREKGMGEP